MGVFNYPIHDLILKFRYWLSVLPEAMLDSLTPCVDDRKMCCKCRARMGSAVFGYRCGRCGQLHCRKCALRASPHRVEQQSVSADCFRVVAEKCNGGSFKVSPLLSPDSVLNPPYGNLEEDEGDDEGNQFSTSVSVISHDSCDADSSSMNPGNELCNFSSMNSIPLDSPCRLVEQGLVSPLSGKSGLSDQGSLDQLTKYGADMEDLLNNSGESICDDLEECYRQESQTTKQPLNFSTDEIFNPPPPKDKGDDAETSFFTYTDEDDEVGDPGKLFESDSFSSVPLRAKEKSCEVNQDPLTSALHGHFRALVSQLLMGEGIPAESGPDGQDWLEIVSSLAWQAASYVKPDTWKGGSMDPVNYVKVKCVASGRPYDSSLVKGVVCTKNVKHKRMVSQHRNPRLLLLGGALECQKVPNELASMETLLDQEINYIKMALSKIEAVRPNVLIVEKSVSSYAQEYLLGKKEISLVINVKRSVLERISRCTGARIVPSIDCAALADLGHCEIFRTEKVLGKFQSSNSPTKKSSTTLMFFEGCPRRLGCTVLLRGACYEELKKVKHVLQYATFAAYHLSLETSFLADEGAMLPKPQKGPSVIMPKKLAEADGCVQSVSNLVVLDPHSVCNAHQKDSSRSEQDTGHLLLSSDIVHLKEGGLEHNPAQKSKYGDDDCFSTLHSEDDKVIPFRSTSDVHLSRSRDSCSGFQHEEPSSLPPLPTEDSNSQVNEDYLTPDNHQSILVSLSSTCTTTNRICERSQLLRIKFYGSFDKPLGKYLLEDLFDETYCCRSCKEPTEAHVRCYTHQQGTLTIMVRRLSSMKLPGQCDRRIWMWHRCLKCEKDGDGVPPAAHRVLMSDSAWGLSFGKFLELSFSSHATANRIASCGHSLQRDCLRFYGCGAMVAFFHYAPLDILSVCLPPSLLDFTCPIQKEWLRQEAALVSCQINILHGKVSDALHATERNITASEDEPLKTSIHRHILHLKELLEMQRHEYDVLLQSVNVDILELNRLKRAVLLDSYAWDRRLYSLNLLSKTNSDEWREKLLWKDGTLWNKPGEATAKSLSFSGNHHNDNLVEKDLEPAECHTGFISGQYTDRDEISLCRDSISTCLENSSSHPSNKIDFDTGQAATDQPKGVLETDASETKPYQRRMDSSHDSAFRSRRRVRGTSFPESLRLASLESFDLSGNLASVPKDSTAIMRRAYSYNYQREAQRLDDLLNHTPVLISSVLEKITEGTRLLLPQRGPDDIVIAVYDDEPTSIISYAMTSQDYNNYITPDFDKISERRGVGSQVKEAYKIATTTSLASEQPDSQFHSGSQFSRTKSLDSRKTHFRISFIDMHSIPSDKAKFSVTCYFAKQFCALRKKCCPSELDYVRSLSRCKRWNAQGGKSNVYFAKSLDERFIIKQVTKTELDSFEDLAPQYFNYLMQCINSGSPTALAKILGIYQVAIKRSKGGRAAKMDIMVMENLFFNKNISRIYDLKGSLRSRYNADTSGTNKVLLDMNLLETKPIFLGSKAKRRLERAIWNDTSFLASVYVMDYSLLVGVDEVQKELVVGIIDFMRQYTWDKQLETWVKASGILGGPKNATPTVISPLEYKKRFRKAMSGYFLTVPEQ